MPQRVLAEAIADFTGGLNLISDHALLGPNEAVEATNIDFTARGGFRRRKAVDTFPAAGGTAGKFSAVPKTVHYLPGGTSPLVVQLDGSLTSWTDAGAAGPTAVFPSGIYSQSAVMNSRLYVTGDQASPAAVIRFTGAAYTTLGTAFNDTLTAPTGGNCPAARCVASWHNYLWVANTRESATNFPNRVRFSHPNQPEDFRTLDFIDVGVGEDGDEIVALVPNGDRLFVFKRNSIWLVTGYDANSFRLNIVSGTLGAVNGRCVVSSDEGVFFFSWPEGVYRLRDGYPVEISEKIRPAIESGDVIASAVHTYAAMGYGKRKLWLSVPYQNGGTQNSASFVYDPSVGKRGAWSMYDVACKSFVEAQPTTSAVLFYGVRATDWSPGGSLLRLDIDQDQDQLNGVMTNVQSALRTSWFDERTPFQVKRFRHCEVGFRSRQNVTLLCEVFRDWDEVTKKTTFTVDSGRPSTGFTWGVDQWGVGQWGGGAGELTTLRRGGVLGSARCVQLRFVGPPNRWGVDVLVLKWLPKKVKG